MQLDYTLRFPLMLRVPLNLTILSYFCISISRLGWKFTIEWWQMNEKFFLDQRLWVQRPHSAAAIFFNNSDISYISTRCDSTSLQRGSHDSLLNITFTTSVHPSVSSLSIEQYTLISNIQYFLQFASQKPIKRLQGSHYPIQLFFQRPFVPSLLERLTIFTWAAVQHSFNLHDTCGTTLSTNAFPLLWYS